MIGFVLPRERREVKTLSRLEVKLLGSLRLDALLAARLTARATKHHVRKLVVKLATVIATRA